MSVRRKFTAHRPTRPGTAPGTLTPLEGALPGRIYIMAFNETDFTESTIEKPEDAAPYLKKWPVTWISVEGLGTTAILEEFGEMLDLHSLALEDVLNIHNRAKADDYGDYMFIIMRLAQIMGDHSLSMEQISLFLGKNFVLTFQERPCDVLTSVRERIRRGLGRRLRTSKPDYLAYAIIDSIVDGYFPALDYYSSRLDDLEDEVVANPDRSMIEKTHGIRRDLQLFRHALRPLREVLNNIGDDMTLIREDTKPYLRDCYDHVVQVLDMLETNRERSASLIDIYLSSLSIKTNEIMKVLTVISTIFIPLGFIASLYGMNFDTNSSPLNMPELGWYFGYPFVLTLMACVAGGFLIWFRRRGWLGAVGKKK